MKSQTKRFWAREVMWLLISLGVLLIFILIEWQVSKNYNPVTGNIIHHPQGFELEEYDWRRKNDVQDKIELAFFLYLMIIYPLRYLFYAGRWAMGVLYSKEKQGE